MSKTRFALLIAVALCVGASAGAYKPQCKDSSGRLIVCSGTLDNTQAPTAIAASSLTGTVAQANGGLGVDASALSNGVVVKSGGVMSTDTAPAMSGANITTATLPGSALTASSVATSKITGGTPNRIPYDNGTNASWTAAPSSSSSFLRGSTPPAFDLVNLNTDTAGVVPTAKGGTNLSSFTAGGVFFASDSSSVSFVGPGTAGYVLTSNGTSPTMAAPVTGTTVSVTLTSTTWTKTTFVDSGQKITLPSGGLWQITPKLRNYCQVTSGAPGANSFQLYDVTAGAVVTDSQTFGAGDYIGGGSGFGTTTTWSVLVDVASGRDIRIDVKRLAGPTYSSTGWASDTTEGTSTITAVKLRS